MLEMYLLTAVKYGHPAEKAISIKVFAQYFFSTTQLFW